MFTDALNQSDDIQVNSEEDVVDASEHLIVVLI